MRAYGKIFCLLAGLLAGGHSWAQQWFDVMGPQAEPAAIVVDVDLDSVRARGHVGEAIVRVSYRTPQPHVAGYSFRSFVGSAQFDCPKRSISLISATYFELPRGDGARLGSDGTGRESGISQSLLTSMPVATLQALLKATCALAPNP